MKRVFPRISKATLIYHGKSVFWFGVGAILGVFFLISFTFILFQVLYRNVVYPGVTIDDVDFGGKQMYEVSNYFEKKNALIEKNVITFVTKDSTATISAKDLRLGYDSMLLAKQAYSIGRSEDIPSNIYLVFQGYLHGVILSSSYTYSHEILSTFLAPIIQKEKVDPVDAAFTFENGKVTAFRLSSNGQAVDTDGLESELHQKIPDLFSLLPQKVIIDIPIKVIEPSVTSSDANKYGIKELIGEGTSLYEHSIPGRIYNVNLAASRVNGILVAPNEEFSFAKALGDVSAFTGYQPAYVIANGKTVLGDGGGICQVSTTLFRAILNAGLPVTERHAHAYRVGYYEEDSPPGIDATVYVPNIDLKFRNDTGHYILIQSVIDPNELRLTYYLYGAKDGREVRMTDPVVSNITPAPPPLYTDDPTLPVGVIKQVDFAAAGAHVVFSRTVKMNGKVIINETYTSNYQPWQAAYLRGTKS